MVYGDKTAVLNILVWIPFLGIIFTLLCLLLRFITTFSLKQKVGRILLCHQSSDLFALKSIPREAGWLGKKKNKKIEREREKKK